MHCLSKFMLFVRTARMQLRLEHVTQQPRYNDVSLLSKILLNVIGFIFKLCLPLTYSFVGFFDLLRGSTLLAFRRF